VPREIPVNPGRRRTLGIIVAGIAACLASGLAEAGRAMLNVAVPTGKWKSLRLKDLPQDAWVTVQITTDGNIDIIFIHQDELAKFPAAVNPAFQGTVERSMSFKVAIPKVGTYHVILDNRKGSTERKVRLDIQAQRGPVERNDALPPKTDPKKEQRI
jgi:hypothetical protein